MSHDDALAAARELERLRAENLRLSHQVKWLVKTESELNQSHEQLDRQIRIYRQLYETGKRFTGAASVDEIVEVITGFVLYELGFERCVVLLRNDGASVFDVAAHDGYYDDAVSVISALTLTADSALVSEIGDKEFLLVPPAEDPGARVQRTHDFGLDAYLVFPLGVDPRRPRGLIVAGNTRERAEYHTAVAPDTDAVIGLANVSGQATAALGNVEAYRALEAERKQLEHKVEERTRELSSAKDAAETANRAKSQFLANMTHELRTPLHAIIGYSDLLIEEARDSGQKSLEAELEKIRVAGRHLLTLINSVLDLSKVEAGKMTVFPETFRVADAVQEVVGTVTALAQSNGNSLRVTCPPETGSIHTDAVKVRQILLNLLSNACKFTREGTISIAATRRRNGAAEEIVFTVTDTGIGIPAGQIDRIFEAFAQADAATSHQYGGTGLGLTITSHFCRMLGGAIGVESTPGEGSRFTVALPTHFTPGKDVPT